MKTKCHVSIIASVTVNYKTNTEDKNRTLRGDCDCCSWPRLYYAIACDNIVIKTL